MSRENTWVSHSKKTWGLDAKLEVENSLKGQLKFSLCSVYRFRLLFLYPESSPSSKPLSSLELTYLIAETI